MLQDRIAIFTIFKDGNKFDLKSKQYNTYNKYQLTAPELFNAMTELADIFNNVLDLSILFEVD